MREWNVVVSVREDCYQQARKALKPLGRVNRTDYYNVLALKVDDVPGFLETLKTTVEQDPALRNCLARVIPTNYNFVFQSAAEFETRARDVAARFLPQLAGKGFYVRMHRRGFHRQMSSQNEERFLDHYLLESLQRAGTPGHITFTDPDAVVTVETIGQWAGLSLWQRGDLERYPFLRAD